MMLSKHVQIGIYWMNHRGSRSAFSSDRPGDTERHGPEVIKLPKKQAEFGASGSELLNDQGTKHSMNRSTQVPHFQSRRVPCFEWMLIEVSALL